MPLRQKRMGMPMNDQLSKYLEGAGRVAVAGHTRPDGDCVGSCLALYAYLKENYPKLTVDVYLENVPDAYCVLEDSRIRHY